MCFGCMKLMSGKKKKKKAAPLYKPQGSTRGKKIAAYTPEITVDIGMVS